MNKQNIIDLLAQKHASFNTYINELSSEEYAFSYNLK